LANLQPGRVALLERRDIRARLPRFISTPVKLGNSAGSYVPYIVLQNKYLGNNVE